MTKKFLLLAFLAFSIFSCKEETHQAIDTPETAQNDSYVKDNYNKKEVMIEMRDGIKLHATIYTPKEDSKTYPILMKRTPYSCRPYG